jgi:hypothetical protein
MNQVENLFGIFVIPHPDTWAELENPGVHDEIRDE